MLLLLLLKMVERIEKKGEQNGIRYHKNKSFNQELPGTYGTSLIKNHMLRGIFEEMESEKLPEELITAIRETLDCNPQFHGNVVNTTQMILIMAGSIVVLGAIFLLMTCLPISVWINLCDREPEREQEITDLIERHVRQFFRMYQLK